MILNSMAKISAGLVLYLSCFVLPVFPQSTRICNVKELLRESSFELVGYETLEKSLRGVSTEGARVKYYYLTDALKAVKVVYYGEAGKLEVRYYFTTPSTYVATFAHYYYSLPIFRPHSQITTTLKGDLVVCHGKLVRGIADDAVLTYFERATRILEDVLAVAPRR